MFGSLLSPKFSTKCKHSVKRIKCRMETIRKKKHAMERYLKKDVADLVSAGHDSNAFGRMDALLFEVNQTLCYDIIEKYCCCVLEHLPSMRKERECPKETVEAVATLIFAAARFSDLPELADLRRVFTERYGTMMESYANREFVEKLQKKSFPLEEKLQSMKDITNEFKIDWDVKSFEFKISNPAAPTIDHPKNNIESHKIVETREVTDRWNEEVNGRKTKLEKPDGRREVTDRWNVLVNGRKPKSADGDIYLTSDVQNQQIGFEKIKKVNNNNKYQNIIQMEGIEHHSRSAVQKHQVQPEELRNIPATPKNANIHLPDSTEMIKRVAADESKNAEPHHFSKGPPCVRTKGNQNENSRKRSEVHNGTAINMFPPHTNFKENFNGTSSYRDGLVHSTTEEVVKEKKHNGQPRQPTGAVNPGSTRASNLKPPYVKTKVKGLLETGYVKPANYEIYSGDNNGDYHMSTSFSIRRKHREQGTAVHAGSVGENGNLLRKFSTKQAEVTKNNVMLMDVNDQQCFFWQSKQIEDDDIDGSVYQGGCMRGTYVDQTIYGKRSTSPTHDMDCEEEAKIYKLLQHYSRKNEPGKAETGTREHQTQSNLNSSRVPEKMTTDEQNSKLSAHARTRTVSVPPAEALVKHVRSVSMQPDLWSPNGERAHSRLPDYDDLVVRIAALRKP